MELCLRGMNAATVNTHFIENINFYLSSRVTQPPANIHYSRYYSYLLICMADQFFII